MMNGICARAKSHALVDMTTFSGWVGWAWAYWVGSQSRRDTPARPWMNIGMKTPFMNIREGQKWSFPSFSDIIRPVALGNQWYTPAISANRVPGATTQWK